MSTESYRVVRADGTPAEGYGITAALGEARVIAQNCNEFGQTHHRPYRVQRVVTTYEDVPDPKPMPELPEKVYASWHPVHRKDRPVYVQEGVPTMDQLVEHHNEGWRVFEGTVTDWREVER